MRPYLRVFLPAVLALASAEFARAQLPAETSAKIDSDVAKVLADTGTPSASIAVLKDNQIVCVKAYGSARLDPVTAARPEMRYSIGSVSKQFLAVSILLLAEEGKLRLDDRVARYLPSLTRANDITIRELLSHTSGYEDYYPLDYVAPFMNRPVTADEILDRWAKKPLDFEPGTAWQYSNTNYVVAGRILEKVTGGPLWPFLEARIFKPLGMTSPMNLDTEPLAGADAAGTTRFGLGPLHTAAPEARGWLFAAGELAMTPKDLAIWDQALLEGKILKPASMMEFIKTARLANGAPTNYALGVSVSNADGYPRLSHGGAVSGFVSQNSVWLGQGAAVVVLTNLDGSPAARLITDQIAPLILAEKEDPEAAQRLEQAKVIFADLQQGKINRSILSPDADAFFTPQVLADAASSLQPLGTPTAFEQVAFGQRGGMTYRYFRLAFASGKTLMVSTFSTADGKLAQYLIQ
jgi:D-alanyl-D-alanine carboxypeptidase